MGTFFRLSVIHTQCKIHCPDRVFMCITYIVIMSHNLISDYFMKSQTDTNKAKSTECTKLVSPSSDKLGKQMVHGLKCHLEKCHQELFADYMMKLDKCNDGPAPSKN